MDLPPWLYPLLFATGAVSGLVDSIAGGGGVITLPVLLSCGLPAPLALGTNKLQASFGSVSAAWHYLRHGLVNLNECHLGILVTFIGAVAGTIAVQSIAPHLIEQLIPWLLVAILLYTVLRPNAGSYDHPPRLRPAAFFTLFGLGLGFYDGFIGPGVGSFWTIALITVMGFNFARATGMTKVMNATSNVVALVLFAIGGKVIFSIGLTMGAGQLLGARIGSGLVMKRGARFVRPIFLVMVTLTLLRLVYVRAYGHAQLKPTNSSATAIAIRH
ncbi:TSUP family transporter [Verrucomicrobiota bacterium sgz303538]